MLKSEHSAKLMNRHYRACTQSRLYMQLIVGVVVVVKLLIQSESVPCLVVLARLTHGCEA